MATKIWDNDYPQHLVLPPKEAEEISCTAYRMVSKENPDAKDFLASFKDPRQKNLVESRGELKNNVDFYATSFFLTLEKAQKMLRQSPNAFKGKFIAQGNIEPYHGKGIINYNSQHISMWLYQGIFPTGFIKI